MTTANTYEDLFTLVNLLGANIGEQTTKGQKKLFKVYERVKPLVDKYNEELQDLRLENASVDDKKNLIVDEKGGYTFTKEGTREFNKQAKELLSKTVDFQPINVVNPAGLEPYSFLKNWVVGVDFTEQDAEDIEL